MKVHKLKAPLTFQGGKQRVADKIVEIIGLNDNCNLVDLCCGSGAVSLAAVNNGVHPYEITMVDKSEWGGFWEMVSNSCFDKDKFLSFINDIPKDPKDIQNYLKYKITEDFSVWEDGELILLWLILQAGSFGGKHIWLEGGKWRNASFRNYWLPTETSSRRSPVNPMMPMPNTLKNQVLDVVDHMSPIKAVRCDVKDFNFKHYDTKIRNKERVVLFLDPPYDGTTGYGHNFDYKCWIKSLDLPQGYELWVTEYKPLSEEYYLLSKTSKGGISGSKDKINTEILSRIF